MMMIIPTQAALRASRRLNDYATAVRIFEGLAEKVENKNQYNQYLEELAPLRKELGMYPFSPYATLASPLLTAVIRQFRCRHQGGALPFILFMRFVPFRSAPSSWFFR
jgi:hypothetical protein